MPTPLQNQWDSRYQSGDTPWDSGKTPPEVTSFWDGRLLSRSGTALDLGCGTGTNIAFLARLGLHAVGVEFSATALKLAAERLTLLEPGLQHQIDLVQADVARLPFTAVDASYILDIGCLHAIPPARRSTYASGVCNNLASGGYYHLFAFDRHPNPPEDDPLTGLARHGGERGRDPFRPRV